MAISDSGVPMTMPVAPAYAGGFGGGLGGDGWWILLLLLAFGGGWGGMGGFGMDGIHPWLNNSQHISDGFRDQMLSSSLTGIQAGVTSGFGDVQTALCGGFAGTTAAVTGAQNAISQQLYSNEIASLNRSFAEQTANTQGFTGLQAQIAQCCCDNRTALQAGVQSILDKMCQDKIDEKNEKIVELQNRLNMADFAASQAAQNNYLQNALTAQTQYFLGLYPPTAAAAAPAAR